MSLFNAIQGTFLNNLLETIKSNKNIQSSNNYEFLFEEIQNEVFGGDTIEFSNNQKLCTRGIFLNGRLCCRRLLLAPLPPWDFLANYTHLQLPFAFCTRQQAQKLLYQGY